MRVLLDTNILLRLIRPSHAHYPVTLESLRNLAAASADLCISSQTVYEFLAVATRRLAASGLGMEHNEASAAIGELINGLTMLYDSATVVDHLRRLVVTHRVTGKSVHDTWLVATMMAYGLTHLLTLDAGDFRRFPGITIIDPRTAH